MRAPEGNAYQEVYPVKLEKPLANGDCGSWVFDGQSQSLLGHIVAGSPELGSAYIVPAFRMFEDIIRNTDIIRQQLEKLEQHVTLDRDKSQRHDRFLVPQSNSNGAIVVHSCGSCHETTEKAPSATSTGGRTPRGVWNTKKVKHDEKCDQCEITRETDPVVSDVRPSEFAPVKINYPGR
jgi:hypothetical protein